MPFIRRSLLAAAVIVLVLQSIFNILFLIPAFRISAAGLSDYLSFYSAGKIILDGNRERLYDRGTQAAVQHQIAPRVHFRSGVEPFYHPAYEVLVLALLAFLPLTASYYVWAGVNVILFVLTLYLLQPYLPHLSTYSRLLPLGMALSFFPLFEGLVEGHDSLLLLLIFVLAFVALKRNRHFAAGCLLSLGLFKFQFVIPFLLPLAFNRQTKGVFCSASAMAAILVTISICVTGLPGAAQYVHMVSLDTRSPEMAAVIPWMMPNWRGLITATVSSWAGHKASGIVIAVASLLSVGFAAYSLRRWWAEDTLDLLFSLDLIIAILVSYHASLHDLTLLLVPLWLVGNHLLTRQVTHRRAAIVIATLLMATPVYFVCKGWQQGYWIAPILLAAAWIVANLVSLQSKLARCCVPQK